MTCKQGRDEDQSQTRDCDQAYGPRQQRTHAGIAASVEHRGVASEDDDQDQRGAGAHRVDGDQKRNLPIGRGAEHATGDRVVDKSPDAGDQSAAEKDQVLADQTVPLEGGQALADPQSRAGLHFPTIVSSPLRG